MAYFSGIGLKVKGYKSFSGDEFQGIDDIKHVNVLIGKNNSGKTAFIEFIRRISKSNTRVNLNNAPSIGGEFTIETQKVVMNPNIISHFRLHYSFYFDFQHETPFPVSTLQSNGHPALIVAPLVKFVDSQKLRIIAERNVIKEDLEHGTHPMTIRDDGSGISNFIQRLFVGDEVHEVVHKTNLLQAINNVLGPEIIFEDISSVISNVSQNHKTKPEDPRHRVEIKILEQGQSVWIPISAVGSGIRTVLQTILDLLFQRRLPIIQSSNTVFLFEELENNLHPRIFRRLLAYIRDYSHKHDCPIFLTTHSPIAIDFFQHDPKAQIIHVWREGLVSKMKTIAGLNEKHGILDALGVRASDLLQSNSVIWVEGPSDRIYINRWLELMSGGKLEEGIHYQCVFYGGRLASHLGFGEDDENPDDLRKMIDLLKVNRKPVFVTDSDRGKAKAKINNTKQRIQEEIESVEGLFWLTEGREIENYLPTGLIKRVAKKQSEKEFAQFESIGDYLKRIEDTKWVKKAAPELKNKIDFALAAIEVMTMEDIDNAPWGLKSSLEALVKFIEGANQ